MDTIKVLITNQKGGVGKTTTAVNLASALGILEQRVLLIDADPQANATSGIGFDPKAIKTGIYECMVNDVPVAHNVLQTDVPFLDLLPATIDLVGAEIEMINRPNREKILKNVLSGEAELALTEE